ncbi:membrane protein [Sphaerisporangium rufum]|uniref:Membrane protein n=1 Tax=Sphaerisporangium rufum TaxID=1381558 RepID=A0A919QXU7_9ACTN|nr:cytochrome c oxidase assembly protein [Sphaerisporangium rufum]GII75828.1 membrane protein [Sphaerisporangium rufum]
MTHGHASAAGVHLLSPVALGTAVAVAAYLWAAMLRRREPRGWNPWRTAAFLAGAALLLAGSLPPVAAFAGQDFRGHMIQHLLLGMLGPLGLVLGAPVTLALRSAPRPARRVIVAVLGSRYGHVMANPWFALALSTGGMLALYLTPLYRAATASPAVHHLLHVHLVLAGCLFAWVIAGPDPAPHRPPVPRRLVVLGVAIVAHAGLAQLMYAGLLVDVPAPAAQLRGGAEIMYYGGDVAELLLALAMLVTWRPARRRLAAPAAGPAAG